MKRLAIDKFRAIEQIYFTLDRSEREIAIQLGEGILYEPDNEIYSYIYYENHIPVGFIEVHKHSKDRPDNYGFMSLAVRKHYRNKGIGKRLLREAVVHCRDIGLETLVFIVQYNNIAAVKLAEGHDFERHNIDSSYIYFDYHL